MNALVILAVLGALNVLLHLMLRRFALPGLQFSRRFSVPCAFAGDTVEVTEVVRNHRPVFIPWLRAESRISPHLRFGRQDNLEVSGEMYHRSLFMILPWQQITRRHRVRLLHRGAYDVGNVTLTAGDLLGFGCVVREMRLGAPILVYPRLVEPDRLPEPLCRLLGDVTVRRMLLQDPFLVNGVRPYQQHDNVRDIHWAATARTGELQVRTHDHTANSRLLVVINSQLTSGQWGELMDYEQGLVEYAVSLAATLCVEALHRGLPCGFAANMPLEDAQTGTIMLPEGGAGRSEELLAAMARLRVKFVRRFPSFLEELSGVTGTDVLILSAYEDEEIRACMADMLERGNTVQLHLLDRKEAEHAFTA